MPKGRKTKTGGRREESVESLVELGFTGLEAEVYSGLLQEDAPVTGYRVAQKLGKAAANVYKALESLENKGAVTVDDSASRLCRAVKPQELIRQLERSYRQRCSRASSLLAKLEVASGDDRVYRLKSRAQVLERARTMLENASQIVLVDVFPEILARLHEDLTAAAARGVTVIVKAYAPARVKGATVVPNPHGESIVTNWPGHWLNLVIDGTEYLLALFDEEYNPHQAVWTKSPYLGFVYHGGLASEILVDMLTAEIEDASSHRKMKNRLDKLRRSMFGATLPGVVALKERLADSD